MSDHVFVCYAREDQDFVLELADRLEARGVHVWVDKRRIPPGSNWDRAIDAAILACSHFLIVLSPAAVDSDEVKGELFMALEARKPIVPALHRSCTVPRQLKPIHYVDYVSHRAGDDPPLGELVAALNGKPRVADTSSGAPAAAASPSPVITSLMAALKLPALVDERSGRLLSSEPSRPGPTVPPPTKAAPAPPLDEGQLVAKVIHYYERLGVAGFHAIQAIQLGDVLRVGSPGKGFIQMASSIECGRRPVKRVEPGTVATISVSGPVRKGDRICRLDLASYLEKQEKTLAIRRLPGATLIGLVERYYPRAGAAAVIVVSGVRVSLHGHLHIRGAATDLRQDVESLQRNRKPVTRVDGPVTVGLAVSGPVHAGDLVYMTA